MPLSGIVVLTVYSPGVLGTVLAYALSASPFALYANVALSPKLAVQLGLFAASPLIQPSIDTLTSFAAFSIVNSSCVETGLKLFSLLVTVALAVPTLVFDSYVTMYSDGSSV
jgi:hypothetical protein